MQAPYVDAWVGLRDKVRIAVKSGVCQVLGLNFVVRGKANNSLCCVVSKSWQSAILPFILQMILFYFLFFLNQLLSEHDSMYNSKVQ